MTVPANLSPRQPGAPTAGRVVRRATPSSPDRNPASPAAGRGRGTAPLLAVCGLCGGAGTSTLSYLVARFAVGRVGAHVLVCDTGAPSGGLAACSGVESPRSLAETADRLTRGLPHAGGIYAVDQSASTRECQLRVIATGPRAAGVGDPGGLAALLAMARSDGAHALTVVDCGTLQRWAERVALRAASHVAWVLPATRSGARRCERVLAAMRSPPAGRELIVARRDEREPAAALRALRSLAERRQAPLVLMPHIADPLEHPRRALADAQVSLQAIHGVLRR